ncbi:MAG: GSU2203 family decaheme c-type cytochrome [Sulfolobales archaeon]
MRWRLLVILGLVGLLGACNTAQVRKESASKALPKFPEGATYVGSETCKGCHGDLSDRFKSNNVHAKLADFETGPFGVRPGCESCHGPGSKHAETGDPSLIVNPAKIAKNEANTLCVQCHRDGELAMWHGSKHDLGSVGCTSCHTMHGKTQGRDVLGYRKNFVKEAYLRKAEPELCFDCHKDVMAQTRMPNHHPIKEGKMTCSECHNPHGTTVDPLLKADVTKNELCLKCHQEKSGPYVFEHAPVNEDCMVCHNPHGSVANGLLKQNEPFICLQCHSMHFHAGFTPATDEILSRAHLDPSSLPTCTFTSDDPQWCISNGVVYFHPGGTNFVPTVSSPHSYSMAKAMNSKCTRCHASIHGSDLPSLTVTGGGSRLTGGGRQIIK